MKLVKLETPWDISIQEQVMPVAAEGQALIRVRSAGICGSDIGAFRGTNPLVSYPRTIGHEIAGEIVSLPEGFTALKVGDHVIVDPYLYCGSCYPCSIGRTNCCDDLKVLGVHVDGGMAEYLAHPADMLVKVPEDMPWDYVTLAEPLTIALHGLHRAQLKSGETIAISGAGPIGLLAAMAALYYGATPIMIDPVAERLEKAVSLGVKHTVNPVTENLTERIAEISGKRGVQVVMEASGANSAIVSAFDIVCNAGRVVLTGWPKGDTPLPTGTFTKKELDIRGARTSAGEFEEAIDLIYNKKVDAVALLTKVVPIEEAAQAVRDIEQHPGDYLKVVVSIND